MSVLFFWKGENYVKDMTSSGKAYCLSQNSKRILALRIGNRVWAFTGREDKKYVEKHF